MEESADGNLHIFATQARYTVVVAKQSTETMSPEKFFSKFSALSGIAGQVARGVKEDEF
jgi:hypothetical protein